MRAFVKSRLFYCAFSKISFIEFAEDRTLVEVNELIEINEGNIVCKSEGYYYYNLVNRTDLSFQESEKCEIIEEEECNLPCIEKYK